MKTDYLDIFINEQESVDRVLLMLEHIHTDITNNGGNGRTAKLALDTYKALSMMNDLVHMIKEKEIKEGNN